MDATTTPEKLGRDLEALATRRLDAYDLRVEALDRIRRCVPVDGWCFATADPATLVTTTFATEGVQRELGATLHHIEQHEPDVGKHLDLAEGRRPVSILSDATGGDLGRSPRFRRVFEGMGIGDELRAAVKVRGSTWGFLHLFRSRDGARFDADDAARIELATRILGALLRDAILSPGGGPGAAVDLTPAVDAPSFLLLGRDGRPRDVSANAQVWLDAVHDPELPAGVAPDLLHTLSARALHAEPGVAARARVRGTDDRWYALHATRTENEDVAVLASPAPPSELVPLLLTGIGLTPAERRVTELVLQGRSTKEIAAELVLSPYTVQDRLKAIFDKAGVRSRRELVARLSGATD